MSSAMKLVRAALVLVAVVALAGCSSPDEKAHEFGIWATTLEHVASVDAQPAAGADGMTAHLVVDGAISNDDLVSLASTLQERADSQGIAAAEINLIVGNAWGFAVDDDGVDVAAINRLRDNPLLVGATIRYQSLQDSPDYTPGLHATVGSQAGLRDAPAALIEAYTGAGGDLGGIPVSVSTADGKFTIAGEGDAQPDSAIRLWQAVSGRVLPLAVQATLSDGAQALEITVGTAEEKATAEAVGAQYPEVVLTVSQ
ncbi:MAG: hypothetical protein JWR04_3043 [Rhodoglobus sp.]|nr:hypothetical protein [Rhodoglobus sp.]